MLRIYGKSPEMKTFLPMDMEEGRPVRNLIYASVFEEVLEDKLKENCKQLEKDNKGWKFEVRKA